MKVTINGKEVDASSVTLQDAIESIFGKQYDDIPDVYDSPVEYLTLDGLDLSIDKCDTKEKVNDLSRKLKERLVWVAKHKSFKYDEVIKELKDNTECITECIDELNNAVDAHKLVLGYINSVIENTKKK